MTWIWFSCCHSSADYALRSRCGGGRMGVGNVRQRRQKIKKPKEYTSYTHIRTRVLERAWSWKFHFLPLFNLRTCTFRIRLHTKSFTSKEERYVVVLLSGSDGNIEKWAVSLGRIFSLKAASDEQVKRSRVNLPLTRWDEGISGSVRFE